MTIKNHAAALLALSFLAGCADLGTDESSLTSVGSATFAIAQVPSTVYCLELQAAGSSTITDQVSVTPGASVTATVDSIPVGSVVFSGKAYDVACSAVTGSTIPSWVSNDVTATVTAGASTAVTLSFTKRGGAVITADFVDSACTVSATAISYSPIATEYMVSVVNQTTVAQTFTTSAALSITAVTLPLSSCKTNGLVDAKLSVVTLDATGNPNLSAPLATATVASTNIYDTCVMDAFGSETFTFSGLTLAANTSYALVLNAVGTSGAVYWQRSSIPIDPSDPYAGGVSLEFSSDFGEPSWMGNSALDLAFAVAGNTVCP